MAVLPAAVPTIETARLRLRPYRDADAAAIYAIYSHPDVTRFWSFPPWSDLAQARAYLERVYADATSGRAMPWAVATREDDRLVGTATLFSVNPEQGRGEIGYSLAQASQGRGLATEAVRALVAHAIDALGLIRIEADVDPRNGASRRLLERLGFRHEGLLRERWRVNGETCDTAYYGLLSREFLRAPEPARGAALPSP